MSARRFDRYGIWAVPAFALLVASVPGSAAAFSRDPVDYARYLSAGRFRPAEIVATTGTGLVGVLAVIALANLLSGGRGRWFARTGMVAAVAGSAALLAAVGTVIVRAPQARVPLLRGRLDEIAFSAGWSGTAASVVVLSGAGLLAIGWMLLGVAVIRAPGLSDADGALLFLSAPVLFLGGMFLPVVPRVAAFLLLAAGLGIVIAAGRKVTVRRPTAPPAIQMRVPHRPRDGRRRPRPRGVATAWSVTSRPSTRTSQPGIRQPGTSRARPDASTGPVATRE